MRTLMTTLILLLAGANVACASHDYDRSAWHGNRYARADAHAVVRAAARLEHEAGAFHSALRHSRGGKHAEREARKLASAAEHFRRDLHRGADERRLRKDYEALSRAYAELRRELHDRRGPRHDRHFAGDFRDVARAYEDLERAIVLNRGRHPSDRRHDRYGANDSGLGLSFRGVFDF